MNDELKKKSVIITIAAVAFAALYAFLYCFDTSLTQSDLRRPDVNGSQKTLTVNVSGSSGTDFDMNVAIEPRKYSEDDIDDAFDEAFEILDTSVLGENVSFDNVTEKLNFSDSVDGYPFSVQWVFDDYEIIAYDGSLNNIEFAQDEKKCVNVRCVLKYEGWICEKEYEFTVCAPDMSDPDVRKEWIKKSIEEAATQNAQEEYVSLPDSLDGESISYEKPKEWSSVLVILLLGAAAVATVNLGEKKRLDDMAKKRTKELKRDYSEMIHKLALLMGAGMTVRTAWEHIVREYRDRLAAGKIKKRCVYEEMSYTLGRLESVVSEINAYGEFGTRCDTKEYLKFSSLIVQNLKKGSRELVNLLELEAVDAFEERKNMAKKYGEEAGTKMLFPMVVMLVVVMGIIMFPALMNFSA